MPTSGQASPDRAYAVNVGRPAPVIPLDKRRRGALQAIRGRRAAMTTPPDNTDPAQQEGRSALEEFANDLEESFNDVDRSLTNPETAAVFLRTLDIWETTLRGTHATGVIDAGQLAELTAVIEGMRQAPRLV